MAQRFAPADSTIPPRLRGRIEQWAINPPKTQFQQYGPLNALLSIKFPPDGFLVKPQALLRRLWKKEVEVDEEAMRAIILGTNTSNVDAEVLRRASIDSCGLLHILLSQQNIFF
jgi:hypothetical protein